MRVLLNLYQRVTAAGVRGVQPLRSPEAPLKPLLTPHTGTAWAPAHFLHPGGLSLQLSGTSGSAHDLPGAPAGGAMRPRRRWRAVLPQPSAPPGRSGVGARRLCICAPRARDPPPEVEEGGVRTQTSVPLHPESDFTVGNHRSHWARYHLSPWVPLTSPATGHRNGVSLSVPVCEARRRQD